MPTLPFVQIDAFAEHAFEGNPAAVMRLPGDQWLPDALMIQIAMEHNLSETAFVLGEGGDYRLRWCTPTVEVDLCGHATLAAGFVVLREDDCAQASFETRSGLLQVRSADEERLEMELPSHPPLAEGLGEGIAGALGHAPAQGFSIKSLHHADYWLACYESQAQIEALAPSIDRLRALSSNVICTAPGEGELDFVSRFFAPASGVDEDPVTGSAHATLTPFWAQRLGKDVMQARQLSRRGGSLECALRDDRVLLRAGCVETIRGELRY